uniref:RNA polymerase beta'' subunit n=1 Tax=Micractinium simplicissimum TaxID=2607983 RepID=UPI0023AAED9E|nr:RNA polymerase beta'' subunit [Micractinium simplicissimum]WCO87764.1 RNA polymerase beta'' subunit [Micractinium simplicissimum]
MTNQDRIKSTMSSPIPLPKTGQKQSVDPIFGNKNDIFATSEFGEEKKSSQNIFFNTCFDKNHLKTLIAWFLEQYGEKVTVDLVETLKQVGFHQATRAGVSLGVDDLKIPPQKNTLLSQASMKMNAVTNSIQTGNLTSVEKSQRLIDTWNQTSETLRQTAVHNFRTTNPVNPVYMMAFSGARGNISQVRQLVAMRGLMADPQGAILEFPIQSNFREGLTVTEYLISCYGARKGLVDTALRTATSGYLTRRLVDAVQHVVVHVADCQTKKGLVIKEKNLEQRLIGRVLFQDITFDRKIIIKKNTLISHRLAKQIASEYKEIVVRSPLTCQTEKSVCQLCYGLDLSQGKLVSIGEAVGILAAQSIGEPGTQLTMRTFHTGGVGVFSEQAMKSFTAPFEGKIEFLDPLSGLFVRTPHGNIVYLLKHKTFHENNPILKLTSFEPIHKPSVYEIMHGDVPSGSLLWVKQGECVKSGQLLLQASRLQNTTQEMPESSHPVRAPLSGEVFFQSMSIRVVEEEKRIVQKTKKKKQSNGIFSQSNQKEISPKFPTLLELGNFWVFSSFIQKEAIFCNSFFFNGDLVSSETPIQQYNLHFLKIGQLKKVNSFIVFGRNGFDFLFSNIQYSDLFYFLQEQKEEKNQYNLIGYTSNSKYTVLTWYPFFHKRDLPSLGYCSILHFDNDFSGVKNLEFSESVSPKSKMFPKSLIVSKSQIATNTESLGKGTGSLSGIINKKQEKYQDLNYVWSQHPVFQLKPNLTLMKLFGEDSGFKQKQFYQSSFVISQTFKSFSKIGVFQFESKNKLDWVLKNQFDDNLVKNCHQNPIPIKSLISRNSKLFGRGSTQSKIYLDFVKKALCFSHKKMFFHSCAKVIEKKQVWVYVPEMGLTESFSSQLPGVLLEPGKKFENLLFNHSFVSTNFIHQKDLVFVKSKSKDSFFFYSLSNLLQIGSQHHSEFLRNRKNFEKPELTVSQVRSFNSQIRKIFCFYKQQGNFDSKIVSFETKKKRRLSNILFFQKNSHQFVSNTAFLKQNWLFQKKIPTDISIKSPLFTKQYKTSNTQFFSTNEISPIFDEFGKRSHFGNESKQNLKPCLKVLSPSRSGWFSLTSFLRLELKFNSSQSFHKTEQLKQNQILATSFISGKHFNQQNQLFIKKTNLEHSRALVVPGFSLFFYQGVKLQNSNQFKFLTFRNGWVLPEWKITEAFLTANKLGEFRGAQEKQKQTAFSLFRTQDRTTIKLLGQQAKNCLSLVEVGRQVRWGQELLPGFAIPVSGQIIKTTLKKVTLRKGIPLLASIRGLVHISHKDLVEKNDLLITLRSRRLQTEDIVQGIPKIEQLFEARETQGGEIIQNNMHTLLNRFFIRARQVRPIEEAVQISLTYIQKFLVENILEAYSNQGVSIAEKHVEVVVRQMTARVRITYGGDTGFLPGEFVQLRWIEKMNLELRQLGRREAHYEPVILGITKSVLQSESFLVAASFQQVSKVLVRSALAKKTDFLRGLHENILVGQPIPAGTGMITLTDSREQTQESLDKTNF